MGGAGKVANLSCVVEFKAGKRRDRKENEKNVNVAARSI